MSKPRIFISSTYYDLKHIRASLEIFINSLGFDSILSEKGNIAYIHDKPLDESCYREAEAADIFVLLIGGRYGSEASGSTPIDNAKQKTFFDQYESITKKEYDSASQRDIPIYVLVERSVYSEYHTYLRNKENKNISYAQVESVNVFYFLDEIIGRPRNNPVQTFEKFDEIEYWLREQWSGLFRELLKKQSQQQQLNGLSSQISELKEVNTTLKKYLEAVLKEANPEEKDQLINTERMRLEKTLRMEKFRSKRLTKYLRDLYDIEPVVLEKILSRTTTIEDFLIQLTKASKSPHFILDELIMLLLNTVSAREDINQLCKLVDVPPLFSDKELQEEYSSELSERLNNIRNKNFTN